MKNQLDVTCYFISPPNISRSKNSNTQRTENKTTDVVIHQHSRKLLKMDILMSETCWAHNKWNKIANDIKLVFHSSNIYELFVCCAVHVFVFPRRNWWIDCDNILCREFTASIVQPSVWWSCLWVSAFVSNCMNTFQQRLVVKKGNVPDLACRSHWDGKLISFSQWCCNWLGVWHHITWTWKPVGHA